MMNTGKTTVLIIKQKVNNMSKRKNRNRGKKLEVVVDAILTKRPKGSKGHGGIKRDKKMLLIKARKGR